MRLGQRGVRPREVQQAEVHDDGVEAGGVEGQRLGVAFAETRSPACRRRASAIIAGEKSIPTTIAPRPAAARGDESGSAGDVEQPRARRARRPRRAAARPSAPSARRRHRRRTRRRVPSPAVRSRGSWSCRDRVIPSVIAEFEAVAECYNQMIRMAHEWICGTRRPRAQPQEHRRRHPAPQAGGDHRPVRLGQVVAGLRHDLRRRAAPLRRVAVGLRAAVPRADGEAGRRSDRGPVAGDLDRAEDHRLESALDGRHGHRNLRLPAAAVRQHRRAALPELRQGDRQPVARAHRRHGDALSAGRAHQRAGADRPRPQGRVQEGARRRCARAATPRRASTASSARSKRTSSSIAAATTPSTSSSIA